MCGIVGYVGPKKTISVLIQGLRRLEYRGYDSAGVAILNDGDLYLRRAVGRVQNLEDVVDSPPESGTGIAHTRWATHGTVTKENAHPHRSINNSVILVHNGIIENAGTLREKLIDAGTHFLSQTDSEVLVHIISHLYDGKGPFGIGESPATKDDALESVRQALRIVRGTWGIVVMFKAHPEALFCARNGSPLVVGIGDDNSNYIASDPHALAPHTRRVVFLSDGEIAKVTADDLWVSRLDGRESDSIFETLEEQWSDGEKGDFPHFMLKEIHEQPEALRHCLSGRINHEQGTVHLGGLVMSPQRLTQVTRVGLLGCGTAYHACQVGAMGLENLARIPAHAEVASEFRHRNPVIDTRSLFFAVTQSGETSDTLGAVKEVKLKGGEVMGVVNVVGSSIARECGKGVYIHSGPEMSVASTKAFSNMVAALSLFTLQIARTRHLSAHAGKSLAKELAGMPDLVERYLKNPGVIDPLVRWVCESKVTFFLGRGFSAPVASEGALKLMEVAYIPCIAYPSGEMKHGPIALLEKGSPVIVIAPDDPLKEKTLSNLQECRARGAKIALIHTEGDPIASEGDISIAIPRCSDIFSPLLSVLPLQLLAYKAGLALGQDIDRPRNLAKSVTVD